MSPSVFSVLPFRGFVSGSCDQLLIIHCILCCSVGLSQVELSSVLDYFYHLGNRREKSLCGRINIPGRIEVPFSEVCSPKRT